MRTPSDTIRHLLIVLAAIVSLGRAALVSAQTPPPTTPPKPEPAAAAQAQAPAPQTPVTQGADSPLGNCGRAFHLSNLGFRGREGDFYRLSGEVRFVCDGTSIFAEEVRWNDTTVYASGDLLVIQDGLRVNADRMEMDRATRLGTFFTAYGTARLTEQAPDRNLFGSLEPEVMFRAEKIERLGPRRYRMTHGSFTTCVQASPRWQMHGTSGTVTLDEHVILRNLLLRVKGVPVLYLPFMYYPLDSDGRSTGFLLPGYSSSVVRGQGLSNAFFWAINRSQDATFYHDWSSKAGQGFGADYRYAATRGFGDMRAYVLDEKERRALDGSVERAAGRSFDFRGSVNQTVGRFQLIGRTDYFSDLRTQQLYQQNVYDFSKRDRYLGVTLSGHLKSVRLSAAVEQTDDFAGSTAAKRLRRAPQVNAWWSNSFTRWLSASASGEMAYLDRRPDLSQPAADQSLWRFHGASGLRAALSSLTYLSFNTGVTWRLTRWLDSLDPLTGLPIQVPIDRSLLEVSADMVGPKLERIFQTPSNGYAERFQHLIEPRISARWLSPFTERARVIQIDPHIDGMVGGTTSVDYSLTNRVMAWRRAPGGGASVRREILSLSIGQTFHSNPQAGLVDPYNVFATEATFLPVLLTANVRPTDGITGTFRMQVNPKVWLPQVYSATATIHRALVQLSGSWARKQHLPGVPGFDDPALASHFLNTTTSMRTRDGRYGGSYGVNYDLTRNRLVQQRVMAYISAQCCGLSVDYQTISAPIGLTSVPRNRSVAVSFTLAGIGSFAMPLGPFGR